MQRSTVEVFDKNSAILDEHGLIISVQDIVGSECRFVAGYPGLPNVTKAAKTGDALLFETPEHGILEVRLLWHNYERAQFLVTRVAPSGGIAGAFTSADPQNTPFEQAELAKITQSIQVAKRTIRDKLDLAVDQYELIDRKLDDIRAASERLGRKDWINYAAGALTSMCISAAFSPDASRAIFRAVGDSLLWLFGHPPLMLP